MRKVIAISIILIIGTIGIIAGLKYDNVFTEKPLRVHNCTWEDCKFENKEINEIDFVSLYDNEEYTDEWCMERLHYIYPYLSQEDLEKYCYTNKDN